MQLTKRYIRPLIGCWLGCMLLANLAAAEPEAQVRALIVTGIDHPAHQWQKTTPVLQQELQKDSSIKVSVLDDPYRLDKFDLSNYDVILLHFMNWEKPDPNEQAREDLLTFVDRGGGLVLIHFACGAFLSWPEFATLAGRVWDRTNTHDPRGSFTVNIVNTNHPITRGLAPSFETDDELYICLTGKKPVELLAKARSKVTNSDHPMALVHSYGKGRVFLTPLGHDVKAFQSQGAMEVLRRATAWAAGKEPAPQKKTSSIQNKSLDRSAIDNQFHLPPGFNISLVAAEPDIVNPMSMSVDEHGVLWVTEAHTYRWGPGGSPFQPPTNPIKRIQLRANGQAEKTIVAASGFAEPVIGICARNNKLYATCLNELFSYDIAPEGTLENRRLLVKDAAVPWNPFGMYRVLAGPDNKLWLSIADHPGSEPVTLTGSDGRTLRLAGKSGGMVRCNLDGSNLELVVEGFRAPYSFDIDPWGHLWTISNGEGSPNIYVHVIPGVDYGYASRSASYSWLAGQEALSPPVRDMGAGANTAALHYYSSQFPADFRGAVLVANWGSHGANPSNREIRRFRRSSDNRDCTGSSDAELVELDRFLTSSDPMFRPTGLVLAPDGGLYLLDWHGRDDENDNTGRIFKISYTGQKVKELSLNPALGPPTLNHPNNRVRGRTLQMLVASPAESLPALAEAAERGDPLGASQAIWALSQIHSAQAAHLLARGLKNTDSRIRAHALRQLRQASGQTLSGLTSCGNVALISPDELASITKPLMLDPDPEVRVEAALAQTSPMEVTEGLVAALAVSPDARLVYQIGVHLARLGDAKSVLGLLHAPKPSCRHAALVAIDTARYKQWPLISSLNQLDPFALVEAPPAALAEKLAWMRARDPSAYAAELTRLDRGETLLSPSDLAPVLDVLEKFPPDPLPEKILTQGLKSSQPKTQQSALRIIAHCPKPGPQLLPHVLEILRSAKSIPIQLEAIFVLGSFDNIVPVEEWVRGLQNSQTEIATATLRALRNISPSPELANALVCEAPSLLARHPSSSPDLLLTLQSSGTPTDLCGNIPGLNVTPTVRGELRSATLARLSTASPLLGRFSFQSARTGCANCHATHPETLSAFGPNLAEIGAASQPEYLVESILEPSKILKTGFQAERLETVEGEIFTGLVEMMDQKVVVKSSPLEKATVDLKNVKVRTPSLLSPMPEGLDATMSEPELADVLAYLISLKGR